MCIGNQRIHAQLITYPEPHLSYIYPAGARQGDTVTVELGGGNGLKGANKLIIDGPLGITVKEVRSVNATTVKATLEIAKDAQPGRRMIRVLGGANGLTNFRYFFVGQLPEAMEKEKNNTPATAQSLRLPVVLNGRVHPNLDIDCIAFEAKRGQSITVALLAHGMDSYAGARAAGFLDTSLELLDANGNVIAAAEDTVGLDPVLQTTAKTDGRYVVRIQSLGYKGGEAAVYRLAIGDVAFPTYAFPPGGRRGDNVDVLLGGVNVPPNLRTTVAVQSAGTSPVQFFAINKLRSLGLDLPVIRGEFPELLESSSNNERSQAQSLSPPVTINGRFETTGDEDWYRVRLKKGQGVLAEITAQRHLRSPVDTMLELFDADGKKVTENDDGRLFARPNHCAHDFSSSDSRLAYNAVKDGDYFLRVTEQSGEFGPRAIYRLAVSELKPDFEMCQWPDAVPVWGPGCTAAFMVEVHHWGGLKSDIHMQVVDLPPGWKGSATVVPGTELYYSRPPHGFKTFLTVTAPPDAKVGDVTTFRVVGKAEQDGVVIAREAQYFTLYGNSHNDGMHLRASPKARAVVAKTMDCRLETGVHEVSGAPGDIVKIPVTIHRKAGTKAKIGLVVNGPTLSARVGWGPPQTIKDDTTIIELPLKISATRRPGTYGIVVARSWSSDYRVGRPGPCTPVILLHVKKTK